MLMLLLLAVAGTGILFLFLQSDYARHAISEQIELNFNEHFQGNISIGKLDGLLPFRVTVTDLELKYKDELNEEETLLRVDAVTINPGLWDLLFNKVRLNNLLIENPSLYLKIANDSEYTIEHALRPKEGKDSTGRSFFRDNRNIEIFAPAFRVTSGRIYADRLLHIPENLSLPQPFSAYGIDLTMRLEVTESQKYLDIDNFNMDIPGLEFSTVNVSGQIFNDEEYLELNRVQFSTNKSVVTINSLIEGINLSRTDLFDQAKKALYDVELLSSTIYTSEFAEVIDNIPVLDAPVNLNGTARGYANDITLSGMQIHSGDSRLNFSGHLTGLLGGNPLFYRAEVEQLHVTERDINTLTDRFQDFAFKDWDNIVFRGDIFGNADSASIDIDFDFQKGDANLNAWIGLKEPWIYSGSLIADSIDAAAFPSLGLAQSSINVYSGFSGQGFNPRTARFNMDINLTDSYYDHYAIPLLWVGLHYQDHVLHPEFSYEMGVTQVTGQGSVDYSGEDPHYDFSGDASLVNLSDFLTFDNTPSTSLNFYYDFNGRGENIDRLYGRANLDITRSRVNGDTLQPHQLYVDLDQPENPKRTLRFTSTFLDMFIEGDIRPEMVKSSGTHWSRYFHDRITEEFMLDTVKTRTSAADFGDGNVNLDFKLELKDLELLKSYFPDLPLIASSADVHFNINASPNTFLISGGWKDRQLRINGYDIENPDIMLTAHFRHGEKLREFSSLDIESSIGRIGLGAFSFNELNTVISMRQDTIRASQRIDDFGDNVTLSAALTSILDSASIKTVIQKMELGNPEYFWINSAEPILSYDSHRKFGIENAVFANDEQLIDIQGVFSSSQDDSITYALKNIDLSRISGLVDGRINFQGILNAEFYTKSLNLQPSFEGGIFVDRFAIDGREAGDIDLISRYNAEMRRFDTRLAIHTDTVKYASYLAGNNYIGNDIVLNGYFLTPNPDNPLDTLYHFEADFNEIDLWILPYISIGIFEKVEGRGDGTGSLTGNRDDFYFHADLYAYEGYVKPVFFNTDYNISGRVEIDRFEGVFLDTMSVRDQANGRGRLYGHIDFNNFEPERQLDITLELNSLTFLNNTYEPDAYFYGNVGGTGIVNVSGTNLSPYVRTVQPVRTTSRSRLSIPLLDETRVEAQARTVRFVNDFKDIDRRREVTRTTEIVRSLDRDFAEVFQLDLQFIVSDNNIMQLVFDPVTGEVMNAEGSGRMRIVLEDEEFQMFGGFDIAAGDYQFVGGDIFTRRFTLREGGSIRWDGDPVNARLNITAVYRSRPNINTLLTQATAQDQAQRIPVDLLLDITGTIENIENNFYFEFPSSVDATQNAAILALLNSEEQKLLQATSLLFTGGFIAVGSVGAGQTQELGSSMQSRSAQVGLSHLLSNQINTLLNSNLGNLDIDFNLSGFDQADLGIALRLFDDRLILHREGQVAGAQADIGDVGAKYQISNNLSVELFHRKDPALISIVGSQGQLESVNGVGLEAQMQFNTWQQFRQRIWGAVTGVFGRSNSGEEDS